MFNWVFYCCTPRTRNKYPVTEGRYAMKKGPGEKLSEPPPQWKPELNILTFNIFCRPDVPMSSATEYQEERIELFVEHVLPKYDVVCLQEMFHMPLTSRRLRFIEQAKSAGFLHAHHTSRSSSFSPTIDGGLLVLSRFPIVKASVLNFTNAAFADWYASKGVLYCLVQCGPTNSHFIHLFCTHLQATYDEESRKVSEKVRADQLSQLADFVVKSVSGVGDTWPIIITGDVNVQCRRSSADGSDSDEYASMMQILKSGLGFKGEFLRDLAREIDGSSHPVTYGDSHIAQDGSVHPREVSLTDIDDLKTSSQNCNQSLDKIFWIPSTTQSAIIEPLQTRVNEMLIDKATWKVPKDLPLTHLSDHYGLETRLRVKLNDDLNSTSI